MLCGVFGGVWYWVKYVIMFVIWYLVVIVIVDWKFYIIDKIFDFGFMFLLVNFFIVEWIFGVMCMEENI